MAYQVIKTIHGKKYLYQQSTYREGDKVRTASVYLGAVDESTGEIISPSPNALKPPPKQTHTPKSSPDDVTLQKPVFKLNNDLVRISQNALEQEYKRVAQKLTQYGISLDQFPQITVKHGKECKHYKPAFKRALVVTIPKQRGGREALRHQYRQALHRGFIETLERQAPETLAPFKYAFDKAYQHTQKALNAYLWNCNSTGTFARILALKLFNVINPIPTGKYSKLAPEKLGLIHYGKRDDWKSEYCELMAEINRKGINTLTAQAQKEISIATHAQRKALQEKSFFFLRRRKKIKRLQARIEANQALLEKLRLVAQFNLL